jgi:hypothetical protein
MTTVEATSTADHADPNLAPASKAHTLSRDSDYYFGENITFQVDIIPDRS